MERLVKVVDGIAWMLLFLVIVQISNCNNQSNINEQLKQINKSIIELNTTIRDKEKI